MVATGHSMSILSHILLDVRENVLTVRATDLNLGMVSSIAVDSSRGGVAVVNCEKIHEIVRALPDGEVGFELVNRIFHIRSLTIDVVFRLPTISRENYPHFSDAPDEAFFEIATSDFIEPVKHASYAVSTDETRYYMNGVLFRVSDGALSVVSTDGLRLALMSAEAIVGSEVTFPDSIVPPKILSIVRKLSDRAETMAIAFTEKQIFIRIGARRFFSNLIQGTFPDYERIIHVDFDTRIVAKTVEFAEAIRRVSLMVQRNTPRILIVVTNNMLELRGEAGETGAAEERIVCEYTGSDFSMAVSGEYLLAALRNITDPEITVDISDPDKSLMIRAVEKSEGTHIIATMQLEGAH